VLAALGQSPTPFCTVVTRKAFGVAGGANHKPGSHHFRYAWPSGDWGSLPIEGGIEVAYKAELELAADDDAHLQKIKARLNLKLKRSSIRATRGRCSVSGPGSPSGHSNPARCRLRIALESDGLWARSKRYHLYT
jgi:acetyl-CoA carboxylase carboxyltransferase component